MSLCQSKCGPQTSSISITSTCKKYKISGSTPSLLKQNLYFNKIPKGLNKHSSLTSPDLSNCMQIISLMFSCEATLYCFFSILVSSLFFFILSNLFLESPVHFQPIEPGRWAEKSNILSRPDIFQEFSLMLLCEVVFFNFKILQIRDLGIQKGLSD